MKVVAPGELGYIRGPRSKGYPAGRYNKLKRVVVCLGGFGKMLENRRKSRMPTHKQ